MCALQWGIYSNPDNLAFSAFSFVWDDNSGANAFVYRWDHGGWHKWVRWTFRTKEGGAKNLGPGGITVNVIIAKPAKACFLGIRWNSTASFQCCKYLYTENSEHRHNSNRTSTSSIQSLKYITFLARHWNRQIQCVCEEKWNQFYMKYGNTFLAAMLPSQDSFTKWLLNFAVGVHTW